MGFCDYVVMVRAAELTMCGSCDNVIKENDICVARNDGLCCVDCAMQWEDMCADNHINNHNHIKNYLTKMNIECKENLCEKCGRKTLHPTLCHICRERINATFVKEDEE